MAALVLSAVLAQASHTLCMLGALTNLAGVIDISASQPSAASDGPADSAEYHAPIIARSSWLLCELCCCRRSVQQVHIAYAQRKSQSTIIRELSSQLGRVVGEIQISTDFYRICDIITGWCDDILQVEKKNSRQIKIR